MIQQSELLYTAAQVRRLDKRAIEGHGIPGIELMERAGRAVFDLARTLGTNGEWVVCCGGGNNAGDGYVVARLAQEQGIPVQLYALKSPETLQGDAATAATRWHETGGVSLPWEGPLQKAPALIVDALLGTGLDREPSGSFAEAIGWMNESGARIVAVDIPSGLHADSGAVLGFAVNAHATATFIGNKRGLYTACGPDQAGQVEFSTLETPDRIRHEETGYGILLAKSILAHHLPPRKRNSHKGSFGWVAGIGGNTGMAGAIRLCGEAALRSGAGKVTLATRSEHAALINAACPELMVKSAESEAHISGVLDQADVVVCGTGLGRTAWSERVMDASLALRCPRVFDADALNILAERFKNRRPAIQRNAVLTPHPAEAARLLGSHTRAVQSDRVGAALELASKYGAVVVLKGCGSVIAESGGRYAICPLGNAGMATAGSGDVLAGVVAALMAQGLDSWHAACCGVVAHAAAGDLVAGTQGERGMLASDICSHLPRVLNPGSPA